MTTAEVSGAARVDKAPDAFRTISEVADELDVPQHVLRFWETRFPQIKPMKRGGGRRYYRPDDVALVRGIRHLLYGEGYTIRGVQRLLKDKGIKFVQSVWRSGAPQAEPPPAEDADLIEERVAGEAEPAHPAASGRRRPAGAGRDTSFRTTRAAQVPAAPAPHQAPDVASEGAGPDSRSGAGPAVESGLSGDDLRRLQGALQELGECRRLLDAALQDE